MYRKKNHGKLIVPEWSAGKRTRKTHKANETGSKRDWEKKQKEIFKVFLRR